MLYAVQLTPYHTKFIAHELMRRCPADSVGKLAGALMSAFAKIPW